MIDIEIMEPGKLFFPERYRTVAVRYNNVNVAFNPEFAGYFEGNNIKTDTANIDSIASEIYFRSFVETINRDHFFDTVVEINPGSYSNVVVSDSLLFDGVAEGDTAVSGFRGTSDNGPEQLNYLLKNYTTKKQQPGAVIKTLDPEYGLYTENELREINDTTRAGLLLSFDYFASSDGLSVIGNVMQGYSVVYNLVFWNFYDLKKARPVFYYSHVDTVSWTATGTYEKEIVGFLPPRKDAVFNAADVSGLKLAEMISPHWVEAERLYYSSGHVEMKKADAMIKAGDWRGAAKIWKANIDNPNRYIAAKSMFNLGLACEMEGNPDAAIDWVAKSYHVFGYKNEIHAINCTDYLTILGQRKLDIKKIELQQNPEGAGGLYIQGNEE